MAVVSGLHASRRRKAFVINRTLCGAKICSNTLMIDLNTDDNLTFAGGSRIREIDLELVTLLDYVVKLSVDCDCCRGFAGK